MSTDSRGSHATASSTGSEPPVPVDDLVESKHAITIGGKEIRYTAVAGRVVLQEEVLKKGQFKGLRPKAEMSICAYTKDGADPSTRPVTFAFNGGPGSSSVWLHMGLLGPRRVVMGDAGALLPPPYGLTDNQETLLDVSDLVFIDPVSTGYSRVVAGGTPGEYHGFQRDLESVGELIRLWTTRNGRWVSPKFLAGESYGTLRASALANHLQERFGFFLNGIILISSVIDMGTIRFTEGNDLPATLYLPTYAAIAHYHGLHQERALEDVLAEAEALAAREYPYALAQGSRLPDEERAEMVHRLALLTGLGEDYIDRVNLRIEHQRFFRELLRGRHQVVGRLDGRFLGSDPDDGGERPTFDPSQVAIAGPYAAGLNHYLHSELNYRSDLPYEVLTDRVQPWSYAQFEGRHVSVTSWLGEAMRHNPHLGVYLACGYYDGATPYFAAEYAFAHLDIPAAQRGQVTTHYYPAGHMMYVHEPSRLSQSQALAEFVGNWSRAG